MKRTQITCIVLFSVVGLILALSLPAEAFNGASASAFGSTGPYYGIGDGSLGGGWNQPGWPYQQWQNPLWDNRYPFWDDYRERGWFSNCYSRCIAQGFGSNYCVQVCPV
jgi:hypothetical protein